jgi:hypothetical protein
VPQGHSNALPFSAVFPDTNIFLPKWPEEAAGLADLVSNTRLFNIPIYLLEAVDMELEAHQLREAKTPIEKIFRLARLLPPLTSAAINVDFPNWETVRSELREKASLTKATLGLRFSAFAPLALRDLFSMAVNHETPFDEERKNFQDAVIIHSVIEASRIEGLGTVAFVSKDKDFDAPALIARARQSGITLRIYSSLDAIHEALWPHVQDLVRKAWDEDNKLAEAAINTVRHDLEAFLHGKFIQTSDATLELLGVSNVQTAY